MVKRPTTFHFLEKKPKISQKIVISQMKFFQAKPCKNKPNLRNLALKKAKLATLSHEEEIMTNYRNRSYTVRLFVSAV